MKLLTYNVNGIRAALNKGFADWLQSTNADVVALQEVKADESQINRAVFEDLGYHIYWNAAVKKGYSGVAVLTKKKPQHVQYGCGKEVYDQEGRMLRLDFDDFSFMSLYLPSGTTGDMRQAFKMEFCHDFQDYIDDLKKEVPNLIVSGDYNICHQAIDIHNPKTNANSSGFLPEEREWIGKFMESGFIDSFRHFHPEPHQYTWWTFRAGARERNLGWRIDYHLVAESLRDRLKDAAIWPDVKHSDHCPVMLELH
ncbi:exodeoxyribonuclease III [Siphonobacter aquaeclarae]|uniref:Exodeoxyribonuclease-3 n=1 Tax=Siphonobacter aquaeclarae TaxID=563176 RepID=A0A1G9MDI1_9BACT|nr:exodeoxyribonuclease III [Siphonobacter aquaeclarae]MBO9638237.1 exodeoxyribonuclease III [Siphonobacter aquaeclarae]SDL72330.1 exodeoxyribonuclease-3 [Siphonobacter aquaeclarae]